MIGNAKETGAYVFGLEHVPLPAAVCDREGYILWANDKLRRLTSEDISTETSLWSIARMIVNAHTLSNLAIIDDIANKPMKAFINGMAYMMHVEKMGIVFGCVFAPCHAAHWNGFILTTEDSQTGASRLPPAADRILETFLFMSKELNRTVEEEELIALFVRIYQDLFPRRLLCIKLFDRDNMSFQQVYANGRLREESHSMVRITKEARAESEMEGEAVRALMKEARIVTTREYLPIFEDGITGFDIPLYDGINFYGILNLEYRRNQNLLLTDRSIAVPVAHQMCGALRNARLIAETRLLKDYLEKLLDQANAPVIVLNRDREITMFNQAVERQTGYSREEWLDRDVMTFICEEDRERLTAVIIRVMLGQQRSGVEIRFNHADGRRKADIVFNIAPVLSGSGAVEGIILVGQDLTEIRNLQNQIIRSEKLATLGQVAAGVAHEVGNPLTSISVYANFLVKKLDGIIDPRDLEKLGRIVEASARIHTFTRALVSYGRPLREKASRISVQSLLERALSFCEHLLDRAGAEVVLEVEDGLPTITGIMGNLEQVFVNLITNACHALQGGGTIRLTARSTQGQTVVITVQDTGYGIAEDKLDEIFEPFFSTKPEGLGTGLGLSIARRILTDHNADITVVSEVGQGTTFTITVPMKKDGG